VTTVSVLASLKVLSDGGGGDKIETQKLKAQWRCAIYFFSNRLSRV